MTITDDVAPSLTDSAFTFTFVFSKAVTGFTAYDVIVSPNGTKGTFTAVSGSIYKLEVQPQANTSGILSLLVPAGVATDVAGNTNAGSATATQAFNTQGPSVDIALANSVLRAGQSTEVTFRFTKAPSGFAAEDIEVDNGILGPLSSSGDGLTWTATFIPNAATESATNSIRVLAVSYTDVHGNSGSAGNSANYIVDTLAPTVTSVVISATNGNGVQLNAGDVVTVTTTYSEVVSGQPTTAPTLTIGSEADIAMTAGVSTGNTRTWTYTIASTDTTDTGSIAAVGDMVAGLSDAVGNAATGSAPAATGSFTADTTAPTVSTVVISATGASGTLLNAGDVVTLTTTYSEAVMGQPTTAPTLTIGTETGIALTAGVSTGNTRTWTYTISSAGTTDTGSIRVVGNMVAGITDTAGNAATGTSPTASGNWVADTIAPSLIHSTPADNSTSFGPAENLTFTFSENVELGIGNIVLKNLEDETLTSFNVTDTLQISVNGNAVTINPTDNLISEKSYAVWFDTGAITDAAGNAYAGIADDITLNFTTSLLPQAGDATISMGTWGGQLIAPVKVEGNWYYMWDRNGDGLHNYNSIGGVTDAMTMNDLERLFFGYDFGTVMTESNRTATINGVTIMLPKIGGSSTIGSKNGTAVSSTSVNNPTYDDLLAIWDAHNGSLTGTGLSGVVPGWSNDATYWSATQLGSRYANLLFHFGYVADWQESDRALVAFQVL